MKMFKDFQVFINTDEEMTLSNILFYYGLVPIAIITLILDLVGVIF